jgi:signal transduction histidine kinase
VVHITAPWLQTQSVIVLPAGRPLPDESYAGAVGIPEVAVIERMLRGFYPDARVVRYPDDETALVQVCTGEVGAAMIESRVALAVLRLPPSVCDGTELQAHMLPEVWSLGVGATFEAAPVADRIREEIAGMARDGTLAMLMARYAFFGLSDTRATYDLLEAQEGNRRLRWVIGTLSVALALTFWLAASFRAARQERDRLLVELGRRHAELERFAYTISHDLRAPLVTVKGFLGAVEAAALSGRTEDVRADVARIGAAADRMDSLLAELAQLVQVGHLTEEHESVPFADVVAEAAALVAGRLATKGARLEVAPELPIVRGERRRLVALMQNLLENAAKFSGDRPEPRIEVGSRRGPAGITLFVRDEGVGIEPRHHEKVFGLFERLDPSIEGTGVGLAVARRTVESHGGRIWVESEGHGSGTTICFTLPEATERERPGGGPTGI